MLKTMGKNRFVVLFLMALCFAVSAVFLSSCKFPPWKKDPAQILFESGSKLYNENKYKEAIQDYLKALELDPQNHLIHYYLGMCEYRLANYKEAKRHLQEAVKLKPDSKEAELALSLMKTFPKEKPKVVKEEFTVVESLIGDKQVSPLDIPKFKREKKSIAYQYFLLGKQYSASGKWNLAIAQYEKALDVDPEYGPLYTDLGIAYAKKGFFDKAVAALQKATQLDPGNAVAHYNLGLIYEGKGQLSSAIQEYLTVLSLDPNNVEVRVRLGVSFVLNNQNVAAMDQWNIASTIDPNHKEAHVLLGKIYSDTGEAPFQSVKYAMTYNATLHRIEYQRSTTAASSGAGGTNLAGYLYYDAAIDEFLKALSIDPKYGEAFFGLGTAYARASQKGVRVLYTDFTQHRDPYSGAPRHKMTLAEMYDKALFYLKKAVAIDPTNPYYLVNLGVVYGEMGYYEQAKTYLKKAISADPRMTAAFANLAIIYSHQGAVDLAESMYKRIQKIDPAKVRAQDTLSLIQPVKTTTSGPGLYTPSGTPSAPATGTATPPGAQPTVPPG